MICAELAGTPIQGSAALKPAFGSAFQCIGVRPLSRDFCMIAAILSTSLVPASRLSRKIFSVSTSRY
ncbi:hypothetical protein D3C86_1897900 [compost metagenome]